MLSYVYFGTNDLDRAIRFYNAALAPLGMQRCVTGAPEWDRSPAGWGTYENSGLQELAFWIGLPFDKQPATVGNGIMVAFRAQSWTQVDDFYAAALANGGRDDGAPGLRRVTTAPNSPDFTPPMFAIRTATRLQRFAEASRNGSDRSN